MTKVEEAKDFGDANKPRSWSKYSYDSSAYQKMVKDREAKKNEEQVCILSPPQGRNA